MNEISMNKMVSKPAIRMVGAVDLLANNHKAKNIVTKECELFNNCSYFNIYSEHTIAKEAWMRLFCRDKEKSKKCARKKIWNQTGEPPPENMSPIGEMLNLDREKMEQKVNGLEKRSFESKRAENGRKKGISTPGPPAKNLSLPSQGPFKSLYLYSTATQLT